MQAIDSLGQKYVVYTLDGEQLEPDEYFVVRAQDVFGAAALHGYSHLIYSQLELAKLDGKDALFSDEERQRLLVLADRIVEFATAWQRRSQHKIPD